EEASPARLRRGVQLQPEGRPRRGAALHRGPQDLLAPRERRRREVADDPSCEHHAFPHERRSARPGPHPAGTDPALDRPRGSRRPDRGPVAGLSRGEGLSVELRVGKDTAYAYTGGKPFDPGLPAAVFIHGGEQDHSAWTLQSRYLAHHGY